MRRWLVLIVMIALVPDAWGQQRAIELGHELYEAQEYEAARKQFMRAYEANPQRALLFEIALTYQGEGLFRQAQVYFERYAAEAPASDSDKAEAERLAKLMARAADRGEPVRGGTQDRLLPLFEDTSMDGSEEVDAGTLEPFVHDDDPDDEDDDWDDDELSSKQRTARILFWTSSVVAAAAATTLIVSAYNVDHYEDELSNAVEDSQADPNPANRIEGEGDACDVAEMRAGPYAERAQSACDYGRSWARTANIMTVGLLATGITSMYFLYVGYLKEGEDQPAVRRGKTRDYLIVPSLAPHQVGVGLEMRF